MRASRVQVQSLVVKKLARHLLFVVIIVQHRHTDRNRAQPHKSDTAHNAPSLPWRIVTTEFIPMTKCEAIDMRSGEPFLLIFDTFTVIHPSVIGTYPPACLSSLVYD